MFSWSTEESPPGCPTKRWYRGEACFGQDLLRGLAWITMTLHVTPLERRGHVQTAVLDPDQTNIAPLPHGHEDRSLPVEVRKPVDRTPGTNPRPRDRLAADGRFALEMGLAQARGDQHNPGKCRDGTAHVLQRHTTNVRGDRAHDTLRFRQENRPRGNRGVDQGRIKPCRRQCHAARQHELHRTAGIPQDEALQPDPSKPIHKPAQAADLSVVSAEALRQAPQTFSRGNALFSTSKVRTPPAESCCAAIVPARPAPTMMTSQVGRRRTQNPGSRSSARLPCQEVSLRPVSAQRRTPKARLFRDPQDLTRGECSSNRHGAVNMHHTRAGQHVTADQGQQVAPPAPDQVVDQHHAPGSRRHSAQQENCVRFGEMMQE